MKHNVAAIILAAGSSSRMGSMKQLLRVGARTLVRRIVDEALASDARATFVVLGANAETVRNELRDAAVDCIENKRWAEGIGTSVAAGVDAVARARPEFDAALVMTCDQPHVSAATINRLIEERAASGKPLVGSAYGGTVGPPALFSRAYFAALAQLPPERGAKELLLRERQQLSVIPFDAAAVDLDTPAEYERFVRGDVTS